MTTQPTSLNEIQIERLDDIPLLIGLQQRLGLDTVIDDVIPRHWRHQGLSLGQLIVGWNAYILSEADHRKIAVEGWGVEHQAMLSDLFGVPVRRTDFSDDRLSQLLTQLADDEAWRCIEQKLWSNSISVYQLVPDRVRLDATRFSGYHTPNDDGLMQHGYNSNTPQLAQVKLMAASIDCGASGHLLSTEVVSGEKADDPLYLPTIDKVRQMVDESGLLYIGDSKMSAIEIRAELERKRDFYLVPLAKVGGVPALYEQCLRLIVCGSQPATLIYASDNESQSPQLIAAGYETTRDQETTLASGETITWQERILVVRSLSKAEKQFATLERNLQQATEEILVLTPDPGRGRQQICTAAELNAKVEAIKATYQVGEYLHYTAECEESVQTRYIGRGRGSANRQKKEIRSVRYQITQVIRDEQAIRQAYCQMGWQLYATNQPQVHLPLDEAIRLYRAAPRIERHFHLFKSAPIGISPFYVRNDDQIKGQARLLSLCVRLLTLIEIVCRRHLKAHGQTLPGLYLDNANRRTAKPTAKRLLRAFRGIHRVRLPNQVTSYTTPLTDLQQQILSILCITTSIYQARAPDSHHS
jgi:transposase